MVSPGGQNDLIHIFVYEGPDYSIQRQSWICPEFTKSQRFITLKNCLGCRCILQVNLQSEYIGSCLKIHFCLNDIIGRQRGLGKKLGGSHQAISDQVISKLMVFNKEKTLSPDQPKTETQTKEDRYLFQWYSDILFVC